METSHHYYCHQCSAEILAIAEDHTCPTCNTGFIEELGPVSVVGDGVSNEDLGDGQTNEPALGGFLSEAVLPLQNLGMDALNNAMQDFMVDLDQMGSGSMDRWLGAHGHALRADGGQSGRAEIQLVGPEFQIFGNLRDYAWGHGGLDTIMTGLLNQAEDAGPPPMDLGNINEIPSVKICEAQVVANSSCSVCRENFTVGEDVKQLECGHCFHGTCIVPWLKIHGTCPVCRKVLNPTAAVRQPQISQIPHAAHTDHPPHAPSGGELIMSVLNQTFIDNTRSTQLSSTSGGSLPVPVTGALASGSSPENSSSTGGNEPRENDGKTSE